MTRFSAMGRRRESPRFGFEFFNSVGVLWEDGTFQAYSDADSLLLRVTNMVSGVGGPMVFLLFAMLAGRRFIGTG